MDNFVHLRGSTLENDIEELLTMVRTLHFFHPLKQGSISLL